MNRCPIENCNRIFESLFIMEEHIKRRHSKVSEDSTTQPKQKIQIEQGNLQNVGLLPNIKHLKKPSKQAKPVQVYRKSVSKGKRQVKPINQSQVTSVISDVRGMLSSAEENGRKGRVPSLKKGNKSEVNNKPGQLPKLIPGRPGGKLLQLIGARKVETEELRDAKKQMNTTAPNFHNIQNRSSSTKKKSVPKEENQSSIRNQGIKPEISDTIIMAKTQAEGFYQKEQPKQGNRPIGKRLVGERVKEREDKQPKHQPQIQEEEVLDKIKEGIYKPSKQRIDTKPQPLKRAIKRQKSLRKSQLKVQLNEQVNFQQRTVVIKSLKGNRFSVPSTARCQFLYGNNLYLTSVNLHNLECLRELSLQHNNLKDLSFLNYPQNYNIQKLFLDHNQLDYLDYLPPSLRVLSVTFNQIERLEDNTRQLSMLGQLQEIDFAFNPIRREPNYRLHIISFCCGLKKIDGIKITNFDLQMASQYSRMMDEELGLVPSSKFNNLVISKCSNSPSTQFSTYQGNQAEDVGMSYQELQRQIAKLSKILKQTQENMGIIKQENEIITGQLIDLRGKQQQPLMDPGALYNKLMTECEALQLLNFMQYATEQQLSALIVSKEQEVV